MRFETLEPERTGHNPTPQASVQISSPNTLSGILSGGMRKRNRHGRVARGENDQFFIHRSSLEAGAPLQHIAEAQL